MTAPRRDKPGKGAAPEVVAAPKTTASAPPRVGLLNKLGQAHWGVAVGLGVLLLAVGIYKDETFAQVYGGLMIVLGMVLRLLRKR